MARLIEVEYFHLLKRLFLTKEKVDSSQIYSLPSLTCINVKLKDYSLGQVCLTTGLLVLITSFAFLHSIPILLPVPRLGADQTHLAVHTPGYLLLTCTSVSIVIHSLPRTS